MSVIIPTYKEGDWLDRTVESIIGARTNVRYEIVVVDDASDDGSVERVRSTPGVEVVTVGAEPVGCVVGRNLGAAASQGEYLCFLDSHVLVRDDWLDSLRETCLQFDARALVTGNILNVNRRDDKNAAREQYAYTLKNWTVDSVWYSHGHAKNAEPYRSPLCPGGLMFVKRSHFTKIGGFCEGIKKCGGGVEISLRNYMYGGENVVDPRVYVYHYYKNRSDKKPTFSISYRQTSQCLGERRTAIAETSSAFGQTPPRYATTRWRGPRSVQYDSTSVQYPCRLPFLLR